MANADQFLFYTLVVSAGYNIVRMEPVCGLFLGSVERIYSVLRLNPFYLLLLQMCVYDELEGQGIVGPSFYYLWLPRYSLCVSLTWCALRDAIHCHRMPLKRNEWVVS